MDEETLPGWEQQIQFLYSPCCFFFPCGNAPRVKGDLMFCLSLSASSSSSYLSSSSSSSPSLWWGLECWEAEGDGGTDEGLGYLKPSVWQRETCFMYYHSVPQLVVDSNLRKLALQRKPVVGCKLDLLCTLKLNSLDPTSPQSFSACMAVIFSLWNK